MKPAAERMAVLIVKHQTDDGLRDSYARLMRTRRRGILFGLNGRTSVLTRKTAIAIVRAEMAMRTMGV